MVTVREALRKGIDILKDADFETPVVEAGVILCFVIKCDKTFLYAHDDYEISEGDYSTFLGYIGQRASGKPLQYITGHQEFMSLDFMVTRDVLIPRQDTEILVETVINHVNTSCFSPSGGGKQPPVLNILDLGTGSGCIAVSLAYYIENCKITAVDISEKALEIARKNASKTGTENKVEFLHGSIFDGMVDLDGEKKFDAVVSNPPYIPTADIGGLQREVRDHEPVKALDGGIDGLDFYREIILRAPRFLKAEGLLAFEAGCGQAADICGLMGEKYHSIKTYKDLSGIERVVTGRLAV